MAIDADQPASNPFNFLECFLMPMPIGRSVINLRELLQAIRDVSESVLYYHLLQYHLALTQPTVEYPNDFARWAATSLLDNKLAEKLSNFDPFEYENLELVRQAMVDILEEYLWDLPYVPWARPGFGLHFCEASTVVMHSEINASTLREFCGAMADVGLDSIYYHFFEARWRLGRPLDDFSYWIETNFDVPKLVKAIRDIDVYFHSLKEIRDTLITLVHEFMGDTCGRTG